MSAEHAGRDRRRAIGRAIVSGAVGMGLLAATVVTWVAGAEGRLMGATLGSAALALAVTGVTVAKHLLPPPVATEERHAPGSPACIDCDHTISPGRRRVLIGGAAGAAVAAAGGFLVRDTGIERALRTTPWRRGDRLVTFDGRPISADAMEVGGMLTAWPEDAVGAADAQVVLLRLRSDRLATEPRITENTPEGYVAYSKLCTHMGCPVGLFQRDPTVLVCPCHQAVFDVFDAARPVQGPARRPLPQLPLAVADDGTLRADGGFTGPVGPGWWSRPR